MPIESFRVESFSIPLKRPFVTALGRRLKTQNAAITLRLRGGATGYGEASSSLAMAHLKPRILGKTLARLGRQALGRDPKNAAELVRRAWNLAGPVRPAAAAFESALWQALARRSGLSLAEWLGGKLRRVESDITLSAEEPKTSGAAAKEALSEGFRRLKIKLSGDDAADRARIRKIMRTARGFKVRLLLDGNQGMTTRGALRLLEACLKDGALIELLEQPLPKHDLRGMAELTRRSPVPIAADEMVEGPEDAVRVADAKAAGVINIKLAKSGLRGALEIAAVARAAGLELMIGCMMESAPGLSPSVHLALGTGAFRYVDLDSDHLLAPWRSAEDWIRRGPTLSLRTNQA